MPSERPLLIDVTRLIFRLLKGKRATGVDRVGLAYIWHYRHYASGLLAVLSWHGRVCVLTQTQSQQVFERLLENKGSKWFWYRLLTKLYLSCRLKKEFADCVLFNTGHKGIESADYMAALQLMKVKPVFFVHDLIPLTYPEYCRPQEAAKHFQRMQNMLNYGAALIVNSDDTKRETELFAQQNHLPLKPIQTAWLASGLETQTQIDNATVPAKWKDKPYFVVLGTVEARKNHLLLLHIWRQMVEQYSKENVPHLLIIGQRGWECEQVIDLLERCDKIQGVVHEINHADDTQLAVLLNHARALLFPSFTEGFGMPLLEAFQQNVPVIAADIPVFREIGQNIPEFVSPLNGHQWINLIQEYALDNSILRQKQLVRLQHYQTWTWNNHFQAVDVFLQQQQLLP